MSKYKNSILAQYIKACCKKVQKIPICNILCPKRGITHSKFDEIWRNAHLITHHYKAKNKISAQYPKACRNKMCLWNTDAPGPQQIVQVLYELPNIDLSPSPGSWDVSNMWVTLRWTYSTSLVILWPCRIKIS